MNDTLQIGLPSCLFLTIITCMSFCWASAMAAARSISPIILPLSSISITLEDGIFQSVRGCTEMYK